MLTGGAGAHAGQPISTAGVALEDAPAAIILLHGRGGDGPDMLGLAQLVAGDEMAALAPNAAGQTWYPNRFIEPTSRNEPFLSSALSVVDDLVVRAVAAGVPPARLALVGFSQGACLALEYALRRDGPLGAVIGLSGGLIGDRVSGTGRPRHDGLPVFLGCSERDPHIPIGRVHETAEIFRVLGAAIVTRVYPGSSHGINPDEIREAKRLIAGLITP
jgi:phospholipase/carboxylesterase